MDGMILVKYTINGNDIICISPPCFIYFIFDNIKHNALMHMLNKYIRWFALLVKHKYGSGIVNYLTI